MPEIPGKFARTFFALHRFLICAFFLAPLSLSLAGVISAQSAAEWSQIKSKCGLPAGTIYNTWVAQGAPCNQGSSASNALASQQQQLASQVALTGGKMIGEGLHDLLFGKPETPEHQQLRIAAQQLNNSGVWYLRHNDYPNAITEFRKALEKTPNDPTIIANLTYARRRLEESSRNNAFAGQNSDALGNVLQSIPETSRPPSWDRPQNLSSNIDVNFTSNTVNLQNAAKTSVDPAFLKKDDPSSGHPLQSKEDLNKAFDKAIQPAAPAQTDRQQLDSEFDKLAAPATQAQPQPKSPAPQTKKPAAKPQPQPPAPPQNSAEQP